MHESPLSRSLSPSSPLSTIWSTVFRHNFNVISSGDFLEDNLSYFMFLEDSGPVSITEFIMLHYTVILNMGKILAGFTITFSEET